MNLPDHTGSSGVDPAEADTDMAATILTSGAGIREDIGGRIGPYKLLQVIGEGGCGTVFMAEQESPVRRRVALKLIKLGMDTKAVIARFELERQALALMDHPHIARVLDAGATETGRPYFVMELVKGVRITEYCDQNHLSVPDRLGLFNQVCHAIQHAHQKGIVHRDIKPSNILVTLHDNQPVPKVIDFGIAKATDQTLTSHTLITTLDQFVGTPAYMSPEQAELSGLDIDTRSDIYSLGVLLYELLTGQTPFDPRAAMKAGISEVRRQIREEDAIPPSTKLRSFAAADLTTTARRREMDPPRLIHLLKGDLDCIVMKCLEKDRTRRYDTANALAADVHHFLANEPVQARPASQMYRFQKLVRRNRAAFAAVTGVAASLIFALAISAWQVVEKSKAYTRAVNAEQEQSRLREAAETARQTEASLRAEAQTSRAREVDLRRRAQARAYAADMNVAQRAIELNNFGRARSLLDRHRPKPGEEDIRGWEWRFLWQQYRSDAEFSLGPTNDWVNALAVSADGQLVAMGERDSGNLKVWNLRTRQLITTQACGDYITKLAFSPAGPLLAVGTFVKTATNLGGVVLIISPDGAKPRREIRLDALCAGLQFSPDGAELTINAGRTVTRWRVTDGELLARQALPHKVAGDSQGSVFSKDLRLIAVNSNGELAIVEWASGRQLWSKPPTDKYYTSAAFSPDGRFLVTAAGYAETLARVWDARTGAEVKALAGHGAYVLDLAFSPDGQTLATASADQTVRLWSTIDWKEKVTLRGHQLEVWRVAWLPDSQRLVSGAKDGSVLVWNRQNLRREKMFLALPGGIIDWAFAPDSRSIFTLDREGKVIQWGGADFSEGNPVFAVGTNVTSARFSPDATLLALCVTNRSVQFWNVPRRVMVHEFPGFRHHGEIYKFSGERRLAAVDREGLRLRFFEAPSGQEAGSIQLGDRDGVVAFRPGTDQMVRIPYVGPSQLLGLTNAQVNEINLAVRQPGDGAFSPDGKFLAVANKFGFARVWETETWKETRTFGNFLKGVHSVAWSPDSKRLAVTSGDKEAVKLWDALNGEELITLEGRGGMLSGSKISPDGNVITSLDENGALNIWRAPSGEQIRAEEP